MVSQAKAKKWICAGVVKKPTKVEVNHLNLNYYNNQSNNLYNVLRLKAYYFCSLLYMAFQKKINGLMYKNPTEILLWILRLSESAAFKD